MRELILDTETTGLEVADNHRITEIGIVEVMNRIPTGVVFHKYLNPEREVDAGAQSITGQTLESLRDMPKFREIKDELLDFMGDSPIVAHNATFDITFINHELTLFGFDEIENEVIDTLALARKAFPGARHSLDALCTRFEIDNSNRTYHGALLDAQLLAEVYIELTGGRQHSILDALGSSGTSGKSTVRVEKYKGAIPSKVIQPSQAEQLVHQKALGLIAHHKWS